MLILGLIAATAAITLVSLFVSDKVSDRFGSNWGFLVIIVGLISSVAMVYGYDLSDFLSRFILAMGVSLGSMTFLANNGVCKFRFYYSYY